MERCLRSNSESEISKAGRFDRIYYGTEFCQSLIPSLDSLKSVCEVADRNDKSITLLTPYVTNKGVNKLKALLKFLDRQKTPMEVVINDWGVLQLIRKEFRSIQPVLGRLLTKQKRDPRIIDMLIREKAPKQLYEHLKGCLINVPLFQSFLLKNNIFRVEIDFLSWDMTINVDPLIKLSLHRPYAYITTTRFCSLINTTNKCKKQCQKEYLLLTDKTQSTSSFIKGNSVFYKIKRHTLRELEKLCIDRVIDNPQRYL